MRAALLLVAAGASWAACTAAPDDPDLVDTAPATEAIWADAGADVALAVGQEVVLVGRGVGEARWDFGDGTTAEGFEVTHTWNAPGNLVAVLTVRSPGGAVQSDTVRVTAYLPAMDPRPVSSGNLAITADAVFVAVPEADHVAVISTTTQTLRTVEVCDQPRRVAVGHDQIAVTCERGDAVALIDGDSLEVVESTLVPGRPLGIVASPAGWFVSLQHHALARHLGGDPPFIDLGPDARALAFGADLWGSQLRAVGGSVVYRGDQAPVPLAHDPGPDSDTGNRGVPTVMRALALSPDGGTLFVGATLANVDRGSFRDGQPLTVDTTLRATLRVIDTAAGTERFDDRKTFDNHGQIGALALSPLGNWLFVAHSGTGTISRLDAYTLRAAGVILDAGAGIDGMAVSAGGGTLFVHAWLDRQVRAYDVSDPSVASPALLWTAPTVEEEPLGADVLRGKRLFHDSADLRMAKDGYMTCSACHPDGRDDGIVWDFTSRGEGLRNTISLEGRAGMGMGPVHWTGNFDEIHDFEGDIRNGQGGLGLMDDADWEATRTPLGAPKAGLSADLDALAAYVATFDTTPTSPHTGDIEGAQAFVIYGCKTCHDPDTRYTDSPTGARHDVGTATAASGQRLGQPLDGFDTPTLLGTFATGPWLHDGSAATIEDAIRRHTAAPEGVISVLADYVRSL